jgi:predicted Rossmann-fold nucleotide-binding protein
MQTSNSVTHYSSISPIRNLCVYCGSARGADPIYELAAQKLGQAMAHAGTGLVYGGGSRGLMGVLAGAVLAHGGHVTGIIPDFLKMKEDPDLTAQDTIIVPDMHTRKRLMFERPLLSLFEHMREHGFIQPAFEISYLVAEKIDDILPMLNAQAARVKRHGQTKTEVDPRL